MAKKNPTNKTLFGPQNVAPTMPEGFYTGDQPNPNLRRFMEEQGTPYDSAIDDYSVPAFTTPIETKRSTVIFNMHTYWSKKPHDAIQQYICHYTQTGDVVLDPFSGSGGTALAALLDGRKAVAIDRSPAAAFITRNHCFPPVIETFQAEAQAVLRTVQSEMDWLYGTNCDRCGGKALTVYTLLSQVFQCPRCLKKVPLSDCIEAEGTTGEGNAKRISACPHCDQKGHLEEINTRSEAFGHVPVAAVYHCLNGCKPAKGERSYADSNAKKREFFQNYDLGRLKDIDAKPIAHWIPPNRMMNVSSDSEPWGDKWRAGTSNFRTVCELYTKRNLWAVSCMLSAIRNSKCKSVDALLFTLTSILLKCSKMMAHNNDGIGRIQKGTYYVPQLIHDVHVGRFFEEALSDMVAGYEEMDLRNSSCVISASDARSLPLPSNSVDYIFTDPPYAGHVQYGELNFVWEAWLGLDTKWHEHEIVINDTRGRTEADWERMMRSAIAEAYRVLKPGRWLSLCYHDTSEGTWALVQDILTESGFVSEATDSALYIGTTAKTTNQYFADKVTKRDLVFNFRKPKPLPFTVAMVYGPEDDNKLPKDGGDIATFTDIARQIVRDFLTRHPGATKDRIYDELVSRLVSSRSMEAHDFDALLKSVADEVQQPAKEDLFRDKEADLFGSHLQSRWYLKETADQVDHAEQIKEDTAAGHLAKCISEYLKKKAEFEGVHYSDLFEQYLPVRDKPRRLLSDWLPEYFIKTASGIWRLPDKEESQQLAKLRKAGTLRRIKRFANALIEGVPVRDKDRPGSDVDLLEWLRQCRRAGLYEQGKAIYEKGGLNSATLSDEQQIEAEDDYRICARRGSTEKAKTKRQPRKKQDDDDE
jgi:DNA modification methylase